LRLAEIFVGLRPPSHLISAVNCARAIKGIFVLDAGRLMRVNKNAKVVAKTLPPSLPFNRSHEDENAS
jgi:hypothetical protein